MITYQYTLNDCKLIPYNKKKHNTYIGQSPFTLHSIHTPMWVCVFSESRGWICTASPTPLSDFVTNELIINNLMYTKSSPVYNVSLHQVIMASDCLRNCKS